MLKVSKAEGLLSTGQKDSHCWHFLNTKPPLSQPPIHFVAFANWSNWWQLNEQSWWYTRNCLTNRNSKRAAIVLVTTNQTVHYLIQKTDHDYFFCFYIHHDIDILLWSLRLSSSWLSLPPLDWGWGGVESNQHLSVHILALLIDFAIIVNIDISTTTVTTMMIWL